MKAEISHNKIVVFSGAGVSAPSGIQTFRNGEGLWESYCPEAVASPSAWKSDPETVLDFYNQRREAVRLAEPNSAHHAIAKLEEKYEVIVITQNIDDLHERAGSSQVLHLHGDIRKARSTLSEDNVIDIGFSPICLGDACERGGQLRPHVVWFGEVPLHLEEARMHMKEAGRVLAVGSSLDVVPAASLLKKARYRAEKILISYEISRKPYGYQYLRGNAESLVPVVVSHWLDRKR